MAEKLYRIATQLPRQLKFNEDSTAEIELFREGEWKHQAAPDGWFKVTKDKIHTFINNFNRAICGPEIPLEFNHEPNSEKTPGFITKMYEVVKDGVSHLYATLKLTDPVTKDRVKNGSLKWISPTVVSDYLDTASGQLFEVIRSATLTNYPHIKGLEPAVVNFEEIQNREELMKTEKDILKDNELQLEDLDSITLKDLDEGAIEMEFLTEDQIVELAEHFEMTKEQLQEKYPVAGTKMYGNRPRIKLPAGIPPEKKKEFLEAFNAAFEKHKDMEKAMKIALKRIGVNMEESSTGVAEFAEKVFSHIKARLGGKRIINSEEDESGDKTKLEELEAEVKTLRAHKEKVELTEDNALINSFPNLTPATKKLCQALLVAGRTTTLKFEESSISLHDLIVQLFEEMKKNPTVNMFSQISKQEEVNLTEDLDAAIKAYMQEHPQATYRQAYDMKFAEFKAAGKVK